MSSTIQCAPPDAGVKVVRPRLRLRALHLDPRRLRRRAPPPRRPHKQVAPPAPRNTNSTCKPV